MSDTILPTELSTSRATVATEGLVKQFGRTRALDGLELTVPTGAIYVLVGQNGAGKTTALRLLLDLLRPTEGRAEVFGLDTRHHGPLIRAGTGYVPESHDLGYGWMRVRRLLEHHAAYRPSWDWQYAARLMDALEIGPDGRWKELSKGQARRVQIVKALAHRPPLLLLDEPTDGLDPVVRDQVLGLLAEHVAETEATVVISTHVVHEADKLADHVGVIRSGRLAAQLGREQLRERLRRYRVVVPDGWSPPPEVAGAALSRNGKGRDVAWTVWGEADGIRHAFHASGAEIRDIRSLTLEEATLTLLRPTGGER